MTDWGWGAEPRLVGPYTAEVTSWRKGAGTEGPLKDQERIVREITRDEIPALIRRLMTAQESLEQRAREDAVAGNCSKCENTRMVRVSAHGHHTELVHCPRCSRKILAERNRVRELGGR